jgi:hypothetical protein
VQVDPVLAAVFVEHHYHGLQEFAIGFVHDTSQGLPYNLISGVQDQQGENDGDYTVKPIDFGDQNQYEPAYNPQLAQGMDYTRIELAL